MELKKVAQLARLYLSEQEMEEFQKQMKSIFQYFEEIKDIDTKGIKPLVTPTPMEAFFREDEVIQTLSVEEVLQNAPEKSGHLFKVPPVV
ncbi:MAG: Asp-tRNA(Asn)/Glu-tRNA(Gln) amidotransferase subunit GatC [Bdellovibrio sp.]|nr:MAG: Asp-tRNA(Asn)/Glu-tRNA(Gln) amidotransferase subunit GatC [Bdellovibrio sp.]